MKNYFSEAEQSCNCCGLVRLGVGFLDKLNQLREKVGLPFKINSMCRCPKHNAKEGGKPNSFHLTSHPWGCCAVDISIRGWSSSNVWKLVAEAAAAGWSIGVNFQHSFIHLDRRVDYAASGWKTPAFFPYY